MQSFISYLTLITQTNDWAKFCNIIIKKRSIFPYLVQMCYEAAKKANKKFFAIQFFGECWVSDTESYKLHGPSTNCWNGVGRDYDNYVYEVLWWTAQVIIKTIQHRGMRVLITLTALLLWVIVPKLRATMRGSQKPKKQLATTVV